MDKLYKWLVVRTKARQEQRAQINLEKQGYSTYYPSVSQANKSPLFPGYIFVKFRNNINSIKYTLGVSGIVIFGNSMPLIDEGIVGYLKAQEVNGISPSSSSNTFKKGDSVSILDGPFKSLYGIYECKNSDERCTVLLDILSRTTSVLMPNTYVAPVHNT